MNTFFSGDVEIAYVDEGDPAAPPILLIHGFASNHQVNWAETGWIKHLISAGRRVVAIDNRGHGKSAKLYGLEDYSSPLMADDAARLLDHLNIAVADVMGYSMGARITAFLALRHKERVRSAVFGGLGIRMITGIGGGEAIAAALEAPSIDDVSGAGPLMFRKFAERTGGDLQALAACMRSARVNIDQDEISQLAMPVLVAVGEHDGVGGPAAPLAAMIPKGVAFEIKDRDHMTAVGDRNYKEQVAKFLHKHI